MPRSAALLAGLALLPPALPAGAQLALVSQTRSVDVSIETRDDVYASCVPLIDPFCMPTSTTIDTFHDGETAPDAGPFTAVASVPGFPDTTAQQSSEITATAIEGSGSHGAVSTYSTSGGFPVVLHSETHDTETRLAAEFEVAEGTPYQLTGSVTTSGGLFSSSSARITLLGPGGPLGEVEVVSDPNCADPETCGTVGPQPIALSGLLAPGTYTLEAVASGTAEGLHSTSGSYGSGQGGSFDVQLALAPGVPSVPAWARLVLALALAGSAGLARSRRR